MRKSSRLPGPLWSPIYMVTSGGLNRSKSSEMTELTPASQLSLVVPLFLSDLISSHSFLALQGSGEEPMPNRQVVGHLSVRRPPRPINPAEV